MTATAVMLTMSRTLHSKSVKWIGFFNPIWIGPTTSASSAIDLIILYEALALVKFGNTRVLTSMPFRRVNGYLSSRKSLASDGQIGELTLHLVNHLVYGHGASRIVRAEV